MFEHTASGTTLAAIATGALIIWLDSRNERIVRDSSGRGHFSLFHYGNKPVAAGGAPAAREALRTEAPQQQRAAQAPSVEPDTAHTDTPSG
jgi:hypothetical protein